MRCPSCSRFVSLDEADPEVDNLEVDEDGTVTAMVRIVNTCVECGEELTEYTFDMIEGQVTIPEAADGHTHELEVEEDSSERTQPDHTPPPKPGAKPRATKARYTKTFYGFSLDATVKCTVEGCDFEETVILSDDVQASSMDVMN